jgi:hypothetical protein
MSSKEQKKLYNDKNIRNRKERNDKRTMKNSIYFEDPFLTEGDYDKNINNKKKEFVIDNQSQRILGGLVPDTDPMESGDSERLHTKNDLEVETIYKKSDESLVSDKDCSKEIFDDSYFDPIVYK